MTGCLESYACGCVLDEDEAGDWHLRPCEPGCPIINECVFEADGLGVKFFLDVDA